MPVPVAADALPRESAVNIDVSCRWPFLLFSLGSVIWLIGGTVLALMASIKLHSPGFLAGSAWLTVGRLHPASTNALLYGFASQAGLGAWLWMMSRLGGARLVFAMPISIAGLFWNFGVMVGVLGILSGDATGFEWLEMPGYASPLLFIAFVLIAVCALLNFPCRRERSLYVSQWYLIAALFWFPWLYAAANYLLVFDPVRGVLQAAVDAWFKNGLLELWFTPLGLAVIFYFVPKLTGRPLYNQWLAAFGFWTLALFANWSGLAQLEGGPLPRWMISSSLVANRLLLVPLIAVALNWHFTLAGRYAVAKTDLVLRFALFGAGAYLLAELVGIITGLSAVSALTQLTLVPVARIHLALHGFVGMVLFSSLYYILPRVTQIAWPSRQLIRFHFWASAAGITLVFVALTIGGVIQGIRMERPSVDFLKVARSTIPPLGNASFGWLVLLAGQLAFAWNAGRLLRRFCEKLRPLAELSRAIQATDPREPFRVFRVFRGVGPLLFLGVLFTLAGSFWGLLLVPQLQIGRQAPLPLEAPGQFYPAARPGLAKAGAEVYRSLGCVECHTQQVRGLGGDLERGWGRRISVAQDYLQDDPVLLGNSRLGPDLANVGVRKPEVMWHLVHLYNPRLSIPGSPMPRYPFLFQKQKLDPWRHAVADALPVKEPAETQGSKPVEANETVPRPEARALVAYLLSLRSELPLFEAPIPVPKTNTPPAQPAQTNTPTTSASAPAPATNETKPGSPSN